MDILGFPHAIMVSTANVNDRKGAIAMVDYYCDVTQNLSRLKKILADGVYTGENFANEMKAVSGAEVEVVKRSELHTFKVLPKRWIVERSNVLLDGWINAAGSGKIVNVFFKINSKCLP